ncbi:putative chromo domain-containing protein [Diaporthe ampelina]|uniref:Putative chromo domain-containing protein n=1 Tax=Diaporthe ampelina TaxID=1214573 RepID=A0A0G2FTC4_9PEZI|nr:putative chromo domain-containing protein [Diaporthe ampelina]
MPQRSDLSVSADDDSDSISLTSVDDSVYDPDTEFVVEDIHCERVDPADGILKYLVEWSNFPLDECTWEPESEISEILKSSWEEKKAAQDPRVAAEFEQKYEEAFNRVLDERRELHRRRNAKRRRLGLEETKFCFRRNFYPDSDDDAKFANETNNDSYSDSNASADFDSDSEEAQEDSTIDHKDDNVLQSRKSSSQTKTPSSTRPNRIFSVDPSTTQAKSGAGDGNADAVGMHLDLTTEVAMTNVRRSSISASEPKSALVKRSSFDFDPDRSKKRVKTVRFTGEDGDPFNTFAASPAWVPIATTWTKDKIVPRHIPLKNYAEY